MRLASPLVIFLKDRSGGRWSFIMEGPVREVCLLFTVRCACDVVLSSLGSPSQPTASLLGTKRPCLSGTHPTLPTDITFIHKYITDITCIHKYINSRQPRAALQNVKTTVKTRYFDVFAPGKRKNINRSSARDHCSKNDRPIYCAKPRIRVQQCACTAKRR